MKNKKKLIRNIFKTRKSFIEGRTTYKYRRIPIATITRIAGQPKIKIFLSAVKPFLTLREVRKGLALIVPDPRQTYPRLVSNLPAGGETRVLQR